MYKEHPAFNPPTDDAVLWRYMDFTKFASLLESSALFFVRADNRRSVRRCTGNQEQEITY